MDGDVLTIDDGAATVVCADVPTANATVHIIDTVLMPAADDADDVGADDVGADDRRCRGDDGADAARVRLASRRR